MGKFIYRGAGKAEQLGEDLFESKLCSFFRSDYFDQKDKNRIHRLNLSEIERHPRYEHINTVFREITNG